MDPAAISITLTHMLGIRVPFRMSKMPGLAKWEPSGKHTERAAFGPRNVRPSAPEIALLFGKLWVRGKMEPNLAKG